MKHIIVTVSDRQNTFSCDMEVPVDLAGRQLLENMAEVFAAYAPQLHLSSLYHRLYIKRTGRPLADTESLAQAEVRNGDYLTIVPRV